MSKFKRNDSVIAIRDSLGDGTYYKKGDIFVVDRIRTTDIRFFDCTNKPGCLVENFKIFKGFIFDKDMENLLDEK